VPLRSISRAVSMQYFAQGLAWSRVLRIRDSFAGFFADAVSFFVDADKRFVDLRHDFAVGFDESECEFLLVVV